MMTSVLELENLIGREEVVQVDSSIKIVSTVNWATAITKVLSDEAYVLIPRSNGEKLYSPNLVIEKPLVIGLKVHVPDAKVIRMNLDDHVSKSKILIRDNWTCQYCHSYGNTIDHIMPKSRGGLNTWGNLCVACQKCNGFKSNHTPQEVGFKMPKIPNIFVPLRKENKLQDALYSDLETWTVINS